MGSLSKAAESLLIAQPNISRSIKELEADLGITIFHRSAKGMSITPEGEEFISYAKGILAQIEQVERLYRRETPKKQQFSAAVPGSCYISDAFAAFSHQFAHDSAEIFYLETDTQHIMQQVSDRQYNLGIIRYADPFHTYVKTILEEKGLCYELVAEFSYVVILSQRNPLAQKNKLFADDLQPYIELTHRDPYIPTLPTVKAEENISAHSERRIFVEERLAQLELLSENTETFLWHAPISETIMTRYGLTQRLCEDRVRAYKDVLIYREGYKLSALDKQFITELCRAKRKYFS